MSGLTITIDRADVVRLQNVARQFPELVRQAHGRAAEGARKQFSSIVSRGGRPDVGVPKFAKHNPVTTELHGKHKVFDGDTIRAATDRTLHVKWLEGNVQHVGWPSKLAKWMGNMQEAANRPTTDAERGYMHRHGVKNVPDVYVRPERNVVDNWAGYLSKGVYSTWISKALDKALARKLAGRAS